MPIILFLIVVSIMLAFRFRKSMGVVEIVFMFPFILYVICCLGITVVIYALDGHKYIDSIEATFLFIGLVIPALILYTFIKLLIDTIRNFKVWKIFNVIFFCVFSYCYLFLFKLSNTLDWTVYRFATYISAILFLYTFIKLLIDTIHNFKVWKIFNVIFFCVSILVIWLFIF